MSGIAANESAVLQGLLNKVFLYRFTRNLDKELVSRKISHATLSGSTGRSGNWFNRTFNELEDMRISTFVKSISAINHIIREHGNDRYTPVEVHTVLDEELFKIATISIDLSMNDIEYLLVNEPEIREFLVGIKVYVDVLNTMNGKLSQDEIRLYEKTLSQLSSEGGS